MCLIIFSPNVSQSKISKAVLERAFRLNPDGAGMAFVEDGRVVIKKAYFTYEKFIKAYDKLLPTLGCGPLLIHFRLATCGFNSHTNTHPIPINRHKLVIAHNGIISHLSHEKSDISDSVRLAQLIRRLDWSLPLSSAQRDTLELICEYSNKLVLLDKDSNYEIINEFLGTWKKGAWYSNTFSFTEEKAFKRKLSRATRNSISSVYNNDEPLGPPDDEETSYLELIRYEMQLERERRERLRRGESTDTNTTDVQTTEVREPTTVRQCGTFMPRAIVERHLMHQDPDRQLTGFEGYTGP